MAMAFFPWQLSIVVTGEVEHQWFGNLATLEWWTHLWLIKDFATWVRSYDYINPIFEILEFTLYMIKYSNNTWFNRWKYIMLARFLKFYMP